jgi:hypothetical protein
MIKTWQEWWDQNGKSCRDWKYKKSTEKAFEDGTKREELRKYGTRWNEVTCKIDRLVVLSCGYGKKRRRVGRILSFKKQHGTLFGAGYKSQILDVYGTLDIEIACFSIGLYKKPVLVIPPFSCSGDLLSSAIMQIKPK